MTLNENLEVIADDIDRICRVMHKLTPEQQAAAGETEFMDAKSIYDRALGYYNGSAGTGAKKDTALAYFIAAALKGHVLAMFNAGYMFLNGEGTEKNYAEAFYWFVMAANSDNERGYYFIGDFYMQGYGLVEADHEMAVLFYSLSAAKGHPAAMYNLGALLYNGDGIQEDGETAIKLFRESASKGFAPAIELLRNLGIGVDAPGDQEYPKEQLLDLTSELYLLSNKDKQYLHRYYRSLVNDLSGAITDTKTITDIVNSALKEGKKADFDVEAVLGRNRDYALKTVVHMVTLLDFAAFYSKPVKELEGSEAKRAKAAQIADVLLRQLGQEFWSEAYDKVKVDIEKLLPACHAQFQENVENTLQSVRQDYPDFLSQPLQA